MPSSVLKYHSVYSTSSSSANTFFSTSTPWIHYRHNIYNTTHILQEVMWIIVNTNPNEGILCYDADSSPAKVLDHWVESKSRWVFRRQQLKVVPGVYKNRETQGAQWFLLLSMYAISKAWTKSTLLAISFLQRTEIHTFQNYSTWIFVGCEE